MTHGGTRLGRSLGVATSSLLACASVAVVLAPAPAAVAQASEDWVRVGFGGEGWTEGVPASVRDDLRAGLARTHIGVETDGAEQHAPPVAVLTLALEKGRRVGISLESSDPELAPGRHRFVDLEAVPEENRSWAIAVAAEELLRAHLAERGLIATRLPAGEPASPAPNAAQPAPARSEQAREVEPHDEAPAATEDPSPEREPEAAPAAHIGAGSSPVRDERPAADGNEPSTPSGRFSDVELGVRAGFEHYTGGVQQAGGDAVQRWWPHRRVVIELGLGARGLLPKDAPDGRIVGWTVAGELAIGGVPVAVGRAWRVEALASVRALVVQFRGEPDVEGAVGSRARFGTADAGARLRLAWRMAHGWTVRMGAHVGGVLRPVRAADAGQTVQSMSGVLVGGTLSIAAGL